MGKRSFLSSCCLGDKLGEEAVVDLNTFTITGKKRAGMRATFNRFEREGYTFSIHQPPFSDELFEELKVSDAWLGGKREKFLTRIL